MIKNRDIWKIHLLFDRPPLEGAHTPIDGHKTVLYSGDFESFSDAELHEYIAYYERKISSGVQVDAIIASELEKILLYLSKYKKTGFENSTTFIKQILHEYYTHEFYNCISRFHSLGNGHYNAIAAIADRIVVINNKINEILKL